jgi:hypothetical protein
MPISSSGRHRAVAGGHGSAIAGDLMTTQNNTPIDGHIDIDELADAAEGILSPDRAAEIEDHLTVCGQCRDNAQALAGVQDLLSTAPVESMPDEVFARLQASLAEEQLHREGGGTSSTPESGPTDDGKDVPDHGKRRARGGGRLPKPYLAEHFTDTLQSGRRLRGRFAAGAIGAAVLAASVGFGSYMLSASAGTAEPPADQPIVAQTGELAPTATAELRSGDLNSHPFSRAWWCVKSVTDGQLSGIRATVIGGESGYLAFLPGNGETKVVFVTGCDGGDPEVDTSVEVREG